MSRIANNALLGGGVGVRVWIREQRKIKIKGRSKALVSLCWQSWTYLPHCVAYSYWGKSQHDTIMYACKGVRIIMLTLLNFSPTSAHCNGGGTLYSESALSLLLSLTEYHTTIPSTKLGSAHFAYSHFTYSLLLTVIFYLFFFNHRKIWFSSKSLPLIYFAHWFKSIHGEQIDQTVGLTFRRQMVNNNQLLSDLINIS